VTASSADIIVAHCATRFFAKLLRSPSVIATKKATCGPHAHAEPTYAACAGLVFLSGGRSNALGPLIVRANVTGQSYAHQSRRGLPALHPSALHGPNGLTQLVASTKGSPCTGSRYRGKAETMEHTLDAVHVRQIAASRSTKSILARCKIVAGREAKLVVGSSWHLNLPAVWLILYVSSMRTSGGKNASPSCLRPAHLAERIIGSILASLL